MYEGVWGYDIETYPNMFLLVAVEMSTGRRMIFEISDRIDQTDDLWAWFWWAMENDQYLLGFNNVGFDYPVIHLFIDLCFKGERPNYQVLYAKAQAIIDSPRGDWSHNVWESDRYLKQIDVCALMGFNGGAKSTSLKKLEIAMRSSHVEDLPVKPGHPVPPEMMDPMVVYCCWDVSETIKFAKQIWDQIEFRWELDKEHGGRNSRVNQSDQKIGQNFLIDRLRKSGVQTHDGKNKRQTPRHSGIRLADVILPIQFDNPNLQEVHRKMLAAHVPADNLKGFFTGLSADVNGFRMDFGLGGLHGAVHSRTYEPGPGRVVELRDVVSLYPSLSVQNGFYPEHLTDKFVEVYGDLLKERRSYPKGTPQNALLKLALNGSYGSAGDKYSPLFDPQFVLRITLNGQLQLARLVEVLMRVPTLEMIQVNTDGVAYEVDADQIPLIEQIVTWWEDQTKLELETERYTTFRQRDVNSYIAVEPGGAVKAKGAYSAKRAWHMDHSALVVPQAVQAYVTDGTPLAEYIYSHTDPFDFMLSVKVPRSSTLMHGDTPTQNVCRYYIALDGEPLVKVMPPLAARPNEDRHIAINKSWKTGLCNDARDFNWHNLNRRWYLNEAEELLDGLG